MSKKHLSVFEVGVVLLMMAIGALVTAVSGIHRYMTGTAVPLHPDVQSVPSVAHAEPSADWTLAAMRARQIVRAGLAAQNLPGLSVAVGSGGQIVWSEGFGWADLERQVPVAPDTRFRIGTASQALTSAAVGLLLEEGRLDLDVDVRTYVPAFPDKGSPITLRQLMGHQAGIRTDGGDEGPFSEHCEQANDGLRIFQHRSLLFEPGTSYRRSSYGWILVSAAVEAAADELFLGFMRDRVFRPLGMQDTVADSRSGPISNRATFYFPRYAAEPQYGLHLMREIDLSCYAGASVFLSSPSDLVRFGMAITRGTLLQPSTVDLLQSPQHLTSGEATSHGLGWRSETVMILDQPTRITGHDGEVLGGMVASLATFPAHDLVVALASNISYADTAALAVDIAQAFADAGQATDHPQR